MVKVRIEFTEKVTLTRSTVCEFEGETEEEAYTKANSAPLPKDDAAWTVKEREVHHVSQRNLPDEES